MGNASIGDQEAPATPARPPSPPAFGPAVRPWDAPHPSGTMLPGREKPGCSFLCSFPQLGGIPVAANPSCISSKSYSAALREEANRTWLR